MKRLLLGLALTFGLIVSGANAAQKIHPIKVEGKELGYVVKLNPNKEVYLGKCFANGERNVGVYNSLPKAVLELKKVCEIQK